MLKILWEMGEIAPQEQFLLLSTIFCYLVLDLKWGIISKKEFAGANSFFKSRPQLRMRQNENGRNIFIEDMPI